MKLMTGMVLSSVKAPETFNEITRIYTENGKKMVEVSQFTKYDDDITVIFFAREILRGLRRGTLYIANNWTRRN